MSITIERCRIQTIDESALVEVIELIHKLPRSLFGDDVQRIRPLPVPTPLFHRLEIALLERAREEKRIVRCVEGAPMPNVLFRNFAVYPE